MEIWWFDSPWRSPRPTSQTEEEAAEFASAEENYEVILFFAELVMSDI